MLVKRLERLIDRHPVPARAPEADRGELRVGVVTAGPARRGLLLVDQFEILGGLGVETRLGSPFG